MVAVCASAGKRYESSSQLRLSTTLLYYVPVPVRLSTETFWQTDATEQLLVFIDFPGNIATCF